MDFNEVLEYKIDTLINLMLTDGVAPCDIANNIFLKEYQNISFYKENDYIIGEVSFQSKEKPNEIVCMKYTYSLDKVVLKIEEITPYDNQVLWDRFMRESELLEEILYFMHLSYTPNQIEKFIDTLPECLRQKAYKAIAKTA